MPRYIYMQKLGVPVFCMDGQAVYPTTKKKTKKAKRIENIPTYIHVRSRKEELNRLAESYG